MRQAILQAIDDSADELIDLARRIHANPEIAFQEVSASRWLADALEQHGFTVQRGIADLPTAFRAEVAAGPGGPGVAFLAEYDALPEIGHACGHNLICTAALGAGIGLATAASGLAGKVLVLGTPAEEGGGGKVLMLQRGAFAGIDAALMFHPADYTLTARPSLASYRLKVKFLGKAAHAAAKPYEGINALDALIQMFVNIGLLRQQLRDDARVHGIITYGGAAPNIIPDRAEASFSVRAADSGYAKRALEKVINCGRAGATATGATFEHETQKGYDAMKPNRPLADAFGRHLQEMGWAVDLPPQRQRMGSTDMGDVSQIIPSVHPYLAIGKNIGGHTVEFREAALTDRAFQAMLTAAKTMALTGLDVMTDSAFLEQVRSDFSAGVKS
ncbi:MAG: M20 family metallopeptidase [Bacillati bacterium ANGP1]|uniref:Peptidase M20 domain-containing protein 2 n=1 Tax=Candidatus Segetimicrobium genomatis TaxID=2569760 RepID=A0A537L4Z3_9BACT|nr:MAG: M20 family metallopeptidase [Terrabacteria group bacterium ANGP1]